MNNLTKIPLNEILANNGYIYDRSKDSQSWRVLKNQNGDKVIVSRYKNGDYLYFNPQDDRDRGNIYNFCCNRGIKPDDLLNGKAISDFKDEIPINAEYSNVFAIKKYKELENIKESNYFTEKRKIDKEFLSLFSGLKTDNYNNIAVPTFIVNQVYDKNLLTQSGFVNYLNNPIKKDKDGKLYDKPIKQLCYGEKGLEILKSKESKKAQIQHIIICESIIDSISLAQIHNYSSKDVLLCATNGQFTKAHNEVLKYLQDECKDANFILGFDNDKAGKEYKEKALQVLSKEKVTIINPILKDFNDDLIISQALHIKPKELSHSAILQEVMKLEKNANYVKEKYDILLPQARDEAFIKTNQKDYPKFQLLKEKASQAINFNFERIEKTFKQVKEISGNFQSRSI